MTKEGQRLTVWVSKDDHTALKVLAVKEDKYLYEIVNEFIKDGLKKINQK